MQAERYVYPITWGWDAHGDDRIRERAKVGYDRRGFRFHQDRMEHRMLIASDFCTFYSCPASSS
jgi:hypothetical protein